MGFGSGAPSRPAPIVRAAPTPKAEPKETEQERLRKKQKRATLLTSKQGDKPGEADVQRKTLLGE